MINMPSLNRAIRLSLDLCDFHIKNGRTPKITGGKSELILARWMYKARTFNSENMLPDVLVSIFKSSNLEHIIEKRDYEKESNENCHNYCRFILENGREPKNSIPEENVLYTWRRNQMGGKNKTNTVQFFESTQKIAEQYGFPNLFDHVDPMIKKEKFCEKVCEYISKNGELSLKNNFRSLYGWLWRLRNAYRNKPNLIPQNFIEIAKKHGLPASIFDFVDSAENRENEALEKTKAICEFIKTKGRVPSTVGKNFEERKLGNCLHHMRLSKNNKSTYKLYDSCLNYIEEQNLYKTFFNSYYSESYSNAIVLEICNFIKLKHRVPSFHGKTRKERKLASWYRNRVVAYNSPKKDYKSEFFKSDLQIVRDQNLTNIFKPDYKIPMNYNTEQSWSLFLKKMKRAVLLIASIDYKKKLGMKTNEIFEEKPKLKRFIDIAKDSIFPYLSNTNKQKIEILFMKTGIKNLFSRAKICRNAKTSVSDSRIAIAINLCISVCKFVKRNNRLPRMNNLDPHEKKLCSWLNGMRMAKCGKSSRIFYNEVEETATRLGFPNLFKTRKRS